MTSSAQVSCSLVPQVQVRVSLRPAPFHPHTISSFLLSAALDGGTQVMIFVCAYSSVVSCDLVLRRPGSFAVGGAGGKEIPFPQWALNPKGNPDYCKRLT